MSVRGDTIAAIATAPGRGGVAVIRVSGPDAFSIATRLTGKTPAPGRIQFAAFHDNSRLGRAATPWPPSVLDSGLLLSFRAPHSYTAEDVVEFQCHGGTVTPRRILEACFAAGARLARRGEFTERAFLNGKLALDQAQSVLDLIDAKTDRAADAALANHHSHPLRALYDRTLAVASTLEHALDIDESELPGDFFERIAADISSLRADFVAMRTRARERALLRQGALVVLAGPPNAGKSSLLNALVGANRAIVSDIPGTTRDAVEVWLDLEGWPVRLVDTAGLRYASGVGLVGRSLRERRAVTIDPIEAEGIRRSEALMREATVVVWLVADDRDAARTECAPYQAYDPNREIAIHAKCDLGRVEGMLNVSAKTGEGLVELKRRIAAKLAAQASTFTEDTGDTHEATLVECLALLDSSVFNHQPSTFNPQPPFDLVLAGNQLRRVGEKLGAELGVTYTEDLLDRVFSRFCVGK